MLKSKPLWKVTFNDGIVKYVAGEQPMSLANKTVAGLLGRRSIVKIKWISSVHLEEDVQ